MNQIFAYTNYRQFLRDWCETRRNESKTFSFRNFARAAGLSSPSFLKMVIEGKRNLADETIATFAEVLKLDREEQRFFEELVRFNQARTNVEKNHHYLRLVRHRQFRESHEIAQHQFEYFSRWHYVAIREMVALPDFREEPAWIAERLKGAITAAEARAAIAQLLKLELLSRDAKGHLKVPAKSVGTADEVVSLALANFHKAMIERAAEALASDPGEERNIASLTVAMSGAKFREVKQRLNEFRKELRAILEEEDAPEEIYQINFQLFSLTGGPV